MLPDTLSQYPPRSSQEIKPDLRVDCIAFKGLGLTNSKVSMQEALVSLRVTPFLGGLSLHLNHLIASHTGNYDWPFGTLPFGLFGSNLDTRDLETHPRTYSGHF